MSGQEWPRGLKRTRQRERVLEVLSGADQPMSALDIAQAVERGGGTAWLSTVYRVLESFVERGVAVRIAVTGSDMALYELKIPQHVHYAVCVDCHRIIPLLQCPVEHLAPTLPEDGFAVTGHNLEVFGHCRDCQKRPR